MSLCKTQELASLAKRRASTPCLFTGARSATARGVASGPRGLSPRGFRRHANAAPERISGEHSVAACGGASWLRCAHSCRVSSPQESAPAHAPPLPALPRRRQSPQDARSKRCLASLLPPRCRCCWCPPRRLKRCGRAALAPSRAPRSAEPRAAGTPPQQKTVAVTISELSVAPCANPEARTQRAARAQQGTCALPALTSLRARRRRARPARARSRRSASS